MLRRLKEISVIGAFHIHAKSDRMEDDDYAIPFNSVMSKEQVDGSIQIVHDVIQ